MQTPSIVAPEEWEAARLRLLVKEKELTKARDAMAGHTARHDPVEVGKVRLHIEADPVEAHPAPQLHTDSGDLSFGSVDTSKPFDPKRIDTEIGHRPDQNFLNITNVSVYVFAIR